jgi:chemotaxis response regulator CheB
MRIAIVNDLRMATEALRRVIERHSEHVLAWVAEDGRQAVRKAAADTPDLILMDLIMPEMDGAEATRLIMRDSPCAILVVTATVKGNIDRVFEAMGYGALDAINTPALDDPAGTRTLLDKIDMIERLIGRRSNTPRSQPPPSHLPNDSDDLPALVAVGGSTGGPQVLATLLQDLDDSFRGAMVIIQHVDVVFAQGLVDWLAERSDRPVVLAEDGMVPQGGQVVVAGTNDHLILQADRTLRYTPEPVRMAYRPSVDVFFRSILSAWPAERVVGVLLTGMGRDGAAGLLELRQAGAVTLAQDQATSVVYGMPRAAAELDAAERILPAEEIGPAILTLTHDLNRRT